jgi:hypothetical protein
MFFVRIHCVKLLTCIAMTFSASTVLAVPSDHLHLRLGVPGTSPWGAGAFYHFEPVTEGLGLRADLGFQLSKFINQSQSSAIVAHVQSDSILLAYSQAFGKLMASPLRWTVGVDLNSPFSYLGEAQIFFPFDRFEPFVSFRLQSTGFSVEGGDGALFKTGSASRFWLASAALGAGYALHPDLRLASTFTYRKAFGASEFKNAGAFHLSMQWLWGAVSN